MLDRLHVGPPSGGFEFGLERCGLRPGLAGVRLTSGTARLLGLQATL